MAELQKYFIIDTEYNLLLCRDCRYGVGVLHVKAHLLKSHRVPKHQSDAIIDEIREVWPNLVKQAQDFTPPTTLSEPLQGLSVYSDGMMCQASPQDCQYVCRSHRTLEVHRKTHHNIPGSLLKQGDKRGRSNAPDVASVTRQVSCQQFFKSGHHSSFIPIIRDLSAGPIIVSDSQLPQSDNFMEKFLEAFDQVEDQKKRDRDQVVLGLLNEVDPWLGRTGWAEYLEGCNRSDLLDCIATPSTKALPIKDDEYNRQMELAIWRGMHRLASISQETMATTTSHLVRLALAQSDPVTNKHEPFQIYQKPSTISDRVRPWQQILMFFYRTQLEHTWKSPKYSLRDDQFDSFLHMLHMAHQEISASSGHTSEVFEDAMKLSSLQEAVLQFCFALLNDVTGCRDYDMPLLCASAVLGVGHGHLAWQDPDLYSTIISRIIKISQLMVVQMAQNLATHASTSSCETTHQSSGWVPDPEHQSYFKSHGGQTYNSASDDLVKRRRLNPPQTVPKNMLPLVEKMINKFMQHRTGGPIAYLLSLRAYGLAIQNNTTAIGHVNWRQDTNLEYKAIALSMHDFRGMIHSLVKRTRILLFEEVMRLTADRYHEIPSVPWRHLYDDPTNNRLAWNFLADERSNLPVVGHIWFARQLTKNKDGNPFHKAGTTELSKSKVKDWFRQVANFRAKLLVLMHMTGGQPARAPEILSLRHKNSQAASHRNIFIENELVVYVTKYHKGYQTSGNTKIIHRYLPREVGELVVWYLWLILPGCESLARLIGLDQPYSDHLFPPDIDGREWSTRKLTNELKKVTQESLGLSEGMDVAAYRNIAIAISRKWIPEMPDHIYDEGDYEINAEEEAANQQAGHSSHVAGMIYARESNESFGVVADTRRLFRQVSIGWHEFLAFASATHHDASHTQTQFNDFNLRRSHQRRLRLMHAHPVASFQKMMGTNTALRNKQEAAISAVLRGDSFILSIMPTSVSQSVLFMLPAWLESEGVTVVIIPLLALRVDIISRSQSYGIRCGIWDNRTEPDGASIVFVTPEMAIKQEFMAFLYRLHGASQLDRIVIDECHLILSDDTEFLPCMQQLGELGRACTQMVLLTATLPPGEEAKLLKRMYWSRENVEIIRASTVRKNIAYSIVDADDRSTKARCKILQRLIDDVLYKESQAGTKGKILVMCETKKSMSDILDADVAYCAQFHAGLSDQVKKMTIENFRDGTCQVLVSTGAFGMGMDIPDIRAVINFDTPKSLIEYAQASGRGGRDGGQTAAIIMTGGVESRSNQDQGIRQYMQSSSTQCRRRVLDMILDGNMDRATCGSQEAACDSCTADRRRSAREMTDSCVSDLTGISVNNAHSTCAR